MPTSVGIAEQLLGGLRTIPCENWRASFGRTDSPQQTQSDEEIGSSSLQLGETQGVVRQYSIHADADRCSPVFRLISTDSLPCDE